jgi:hypothetical protein
MRQWSSRCVSARRRSTLASPRIEVVEADHGLGVADVEGEEHGVRRYEVAVEGSNRSGSADVEADVEGGRRLGDLAGAQEVDPVARRRRPSRP